MISRDQAAELLCFIAPNTQDAFDRARVAYQTQVAAQTEVQEKMDAAVAAVANGVDFWALFATCLKDEYDGNSIIKRIPGTRSLQYRWIIDDRLLLQLKSNTDNLPVDQLEIPGITEQLGGPIEWIALTWEHNQVERFEPAFVQNHRGKEVWRIPVASMVELDIETIKPATPKTTVSSARKPAAETGAKPSS